MLCSHVVTPTVGIIIMSTTVGTGDAVAQVVFPHMAGGTRKVTHIGRRATLIYIGLRGPENLF